MLQITGMHFDKCCPETESAKPLHQIALGQFESTDIRQPGAMFRISGRGQHTYIFGRVAFQVEYIFRWDTYTDKVHIQAVTHSSSNVEAHPGPIITFCILPSV